MVQLFLNKFQLFILLQKWFEEKNLFYIEKKNEYTFFQLVELSKAQDIEAGDGTTTVVIIAGSLLDAASRLVAKGMKI